MATHQEGLSATDAGNPEAIELPDRVSDVLGVPVLQETMGDVLARVQRAVAEGTSLNIGVVNAAKLVNMQSDSELDAAVRSSDVIYADGMSVVWASRVLKNPLPCRVPGIDLMSEILNDGQEKRYRVFCLGATDEVLEKAVAHFRNTYPGTVIAGHRNGYFSADEEESVATQIRDSQADILFVAITSPKKERFMARWADYMNVPVVHGVGGSFDVVAGKVQRAPVSWQRLGLEWLYRVKQEPGRLWKRYAKTNTAFIYRVFKQRLSG